jgi:hypothetical protein
MDFIGLVVETFYNFYFFRMYKIIIMILNHFSIIELAIGVYKLDFLILGI